MPPFSADVPVEDSGSFRGPSAFVPPGRPAALPAGWRCRRPSMRRRAGSSRAVGARRSRSSRPRGSPHRRPSTHAVRTAPGVPTCTSRAYGIHTPALAPDGITGPAEPTEPTFPRRVVRHGQLGHSQRFPLGRPPSMPVAAPQIHGCAPLPHAIADQNRSGGGEPSNPQGQRGTRTYSPRTTPPQTFDQRIAAAQVNSRDPARTRQHE